MRYENRETVALSQLRSSRISAQRDLPRGDESGRQMLGGRLFLQEGQNRKNSEESEGHTGNMQGERNRKFRRTSRNMSAGCDLSR